MKVTTQSGITISEKHPMPEGSLLVYRSTTKPLTAQANSLMAVTCVEGRYYTTGSSMGWKWKDICSAMSESNCEYLVLMEAGTWS